jgi:hypothetical protein
MASAGTFELNPLRLIELDDGDLDLGGGEAIAAFGLALLPGGDEFAGDMLREFGHARGCLQLRHHRLSRGGRAVARSRRARRYAVCLGWRDAPPS